MRKRGAAELFIFAIIALAAIGVLFYEANSNDLTGAQTSTRPRSVPRSGITKCDNLNSMTIRLHRDFELQLDQYKLIAAKIKLLLKIKFKLLQITNTKMKAAVLTCADWHRLVPGLREHVSCDDLDRPLDADGLKTCGSTEQCVGLQPGDQCHGPMQFGTRDLECECSDNTCLEKEEKSDDPKLLIFQKNIWTLKKILILIKIKLEAFFLQYSELHLNIKSHLDAVITLDGQMKNCFKEECDPYCPEQPRTYVRDSSPPQTAIPSGATRPRDQVAIPSAGQAIQTPQDCETVCAQMGMSTQKPGPNDLYNAVKGEVCVKGASAKVSGKKSGQCTCWGKLQVTVDRTPVFCPAGRCGKPVPCNGQVECQIGDTHVTESCKWGGWKIQGQGVVPVVGALVLE